MRSQRWRPLRWLLGVLLLCLGVPLLVLPGPGLLLLLAGLSLLAEESTWARVTLDRLRGYVARTKKTPPRGAP